MKKEKSKTHWFATVILLLLTTLLPTVAKAESRLLQVLQADGKIVTIDLNEEPRTTYVNGNLVITTTKITITYPLEQVRRFTYVSAADGIDNPELTRTTFSNDGETLTFNGLKPNTEVLLYSASGQLMRKFKPTNSNPIAVSVSQLPTGVYIVKANGVTYKITKR